MSKIEFNVNARIFQGELQRNVHRERSEGLFELQSAMLSGEKGLDAMSEEALGVILRAYDGNSELTVSGDVALFPEYMQAGLNDIFMKLKQSGMLAGFSLEMSRWSAVLTAAGAGYLDDKQKALRGEAGLKKLPMNSEKLLLVLIDSDDPVKMLWERFDHGSYDERGELSGILRALISEGYIRVPVWKDGVPQYVEIDDAARAYGEREAGYGALSGHIALPLKEEPDKSRSPKRFDLFLCYAGRDRAAYAEDLFRSLGRLGVSILYHNAVLSTGDDWKEKILEGVGAAEFTLLVIPEDFFGGGWTEKELGRLLHRKNPGGQKIILPLLHKITPEELYSKYPSLSGIECLTADRSNEEISLIFARELIKRLRSFII